MGFATVDYVIVIVYLVGMAVWGVIAGGRQTSARDYFLGSKQIPWWAVCFAIVATETSTLTFISIPGLAYATNLNFLQVTFGYLLGRIVISAVLLPVYARGDLVTAYELLGHRFGPAMRNVTSVTFMCTRLLADGVRLFATAIPLALLLKGWHAFTDVSNEHIYAVAIAVMAVITLIYTFAGGVRAVIWTDVVQMFLYLAGAVGTILVILSGPAGGPLSAEKLSLLNFEFGSLREFFSTPYTLIAGLIGGGFLSMASHGTDQIIVQRLLTLRTLREGQRALIGSGIIVIFQFALFLAIGLLLYVHYHGAPLAELGLAKGDEIFPKFILERMPSGLSGLLIAGLLAAAMSTLSGSINSLAAATIHDLYRPYLAPAMSDARELFLSRIVSLFWCALLVGVALFFVTQTSRTLVELALSIASVTYGGLLGAFLLGVLFPHVRQRDAIAGFLTGIAVMIGVSQTPIAWTWFTCIGTLATIVTGNVVAMVSRRVSRT